MRLETELNGCGYGGRSIGSGRVNGVTLGFGFAIDKHRNKCCCANSRFYNPSCVSLATAAADPVYIRKWYCHYSAESDPLCTDDIRWVVLVGLLFCMGGNKYDDTSWDINRQHRGWDFCSSGVICLILRREHEMAAF